MCELPPPYGITIEFAVGDELEQYFKTNIFQIEYSVDILDVPYGLAVIPFVCNVLPIVWLTDAKNHVILALNIQTCYN